MWDRQRINNAEPLTIAGIKVLTLSPPFLLLVPEFPSSLPPSLTNHLLAPRPSTLQQPEDGAWIGNQVSRRARLAGYFKVPQNNNIIIYALGRRAQLLCVLPMFVYSVCSKCRLLCAVGCRRAPQTPPCCMRQRRETRKHMYSECVCHNQRKASHGGTAAFCRHDR